ncbi:MAG TPA: EAL domain-containing protein [Dehalococcoidia bacterium]|nr:EAL domain-containing protein [Dehalococcoidia bacterium]
MLSKLNALARIADSREPETADIEASCRIIAELLGAEDAYVLRAGDPHFVRLGCPCDPEAYEIKQKGYWIAWRELASHPELTVASFTAKDRIVSGGGAMTPGRPATHALTVLPGDESNSELLIVRGPWPAGPTAEQVELLGLVRPLLGHLVSNLLDAERRTRQRQQLEALADVARTFSEARDADSVVGRLATALAKASGFDWVVLATFDAACERVAERAMNMARYSSTDTATRYLRSREGRDQGEIQLAIALARQDAVIRVADAYDPDLAQKPEVALIREELPYLQKYWERAHVLSLAILPIVFQNRAVGSVSFSSSTRRALDDDEVNFLKALASQAATAIHGLRLYRDLEQSREDLRRSEERFRSLVQNGSDLITIIDAEGTLQYTSPAVERILGYAPDDWLGTNILTLLHPDDAPRAAQSLAAVIDQPGEHPPTTVRVRHRDGTWRYVETTANNLLHEPAVGGIVHNSHDVTERWLAAEAMRQSEERFRSLVQNASDLITVIEPDTTVRYQSPSIERVLGYAAAEILGTRLAELIHIDDVARVLAVLSDASHNPGSTATAEARVRRRDGAWRDLEFIGTDQCTNPAIGGFVLNIRDVTERKSLEQQLRHQALHDPLTQLANRTRFADRLGHALIRATRTGQLVAVLFMDLDNFKGVNDSLGHSAGDQLLTQVAERVQACLRPGDTVARLGGDEFAILLEDVAAVEDATAVTQRIFEHLEPPFRLEGKELIVRASVGIAVSAPGEATEADALLRDADVAMYVAKSHGKGRYEVFEESMQVSMMERLELLADLQRAVEREEFVLQYQPMVLLKDGHLFGVEALVRWRHPRRGTIPPAEFIALAEESGAILGLGRWVLREACRQARAWQEAQPARTDWTISVNVSVKQLQHAGFVEDVARALADSGLDPSRLILEITESVMMQDVAPMLARLRELKALGVRLAIDDFGTGYSSLSYLREFPFDLLKIDKSFIDDMGAIVRSKELTRAIIELGKTLDLELVAEGIERNDQLARLQTLDCELGQGFYFAQPMDADAILALLAGEGSAEESDAA